MSDAPDDDTAPEENDAELESTAAPRAKIMLVDDERDILSALNRLLKRQYEVVTFEEASEALEYLKGEDHHVNLIISDMRMPNMDGAEFLSQAKKIEPLAVRMLLTGYADMESTIRAINDGEIYAYLSKPWNNEDLKLAIKRALEFKTVSLERDSLVKTLEEKNKELSSMNDELEVRVSKRTSQLEKSQESLKKSLAYQKGLYRQLVTLVSEFIELRIGTHHAGHGVHTSGQARVLAERLGCETKDITQIYFATLLHQVGMLALSDKVITYRHHMQMNEVFKQHPVLGSQLLEKISAFKQVAHIIRHQDENFDGTGIPDHLSAHNIPFGSRIVRVVCDYDLILREGGEYASPPQAAEQLKRFANELYDKEIVDAFLKMIKDKPRHENVDVSYCVTSTELRPGQVVMRDVVTPSGMIMLTKDTALTSSAIKRLQEYEEEHKICLNIQI